MKVLLLTSTIKSNSDRKIPSFVLEQVLTISKKYKDVKFHVIAPHDNDLKTSPEWITNRIHLDYFHYFLPHSLETLNSQGVLPTIKRQPIKSILIPFIFIAFLAKCLKSIKKHNPDLIYAHWLTPQGIVASIASKLTSTPFCYTSHSSDALILSKLPLLGNFLVRDATKRASKVSVVSKRTKEKLRIFFTNKEWSLLSEKIELLPMGTHLPQKLTERNENRKGQKKLILFIGRLAEKKGLQYCVPAVDLFLTNNPEYEFKIAGTGPYQDILKNIVSKSVNKDRIHLIGHVDGKQKRELISDSHLFVVPSIITDSGDAEGLPVSLLEGLSYGKLCIATNESGADDIVVDGINGILVNEKDVPALIGALIRADSLSDEIKLEMANAAIETSKQYDWHKVSSEYYRFLKEAALDEKNIDIK